MVCEHTASIVLKGIVVFLNERGRDDSYSSITTLDDMNSEMGSYGVKVEDQFTVDLILIDKENVSVFVQNEQYAGMAEIGG